jgi:hypothetical protein
MQTAHTTGERNWICRIAGADFLQRQIRQNHGLVISIVFKAIRNT